MARPIILSNSRMCVGLDEHGLVQDFYYPHVGQDNMSSARHVHHKLGIWVNGEFSWVDDGSWEISIVYADDALVGYVVYESRHFGLTLRLKSFVDAKEDIFGRILTFENTSDKPLEVRFFFHQVFQISRTGRSDTALYVPSNHPYVLTYRGNTAFVSGLRTENGLPFDQYSIGNYKMEGKEGTYADAIDGELSDNNVEHGGVDSVLRTRVLIQPAANWTVDYWVAASKESYHEATKLHRQIASSGLAPYLSRTHTHWRDWLERSSDFVSQVDPIYRRRLVTSLLVVKAHIDYDGGVLASADSSIYNYGRDYYSYVWPRDSVYALLPLVRLGYYEEAIAFLRFCQRVKHPRGYMHHKYQPDGAIGSTWHPMIQNGHPELNIQEDETAALIILFREVIEIYDDTEVLNDIYDDLIRPAAEFISTYIDNDTGLPHASYDVWEEKFLCTTYTTTIVLQGLKDAIELAQMRHEEEDVQAWQYSFDTILKNFWKLFDDKEQHFAKGILLHPGGEVYKDTTLDSSTFYALTCFRPLPIDNASVQATIMAVEKNLKDLGPAGGVIRYINDPYMMDSTKFNSNPWIICTLWVAQYYIQTDRITEAMRILDWAAKLSLPSGIMSEQVDPGDGSIRGVAPLVWSHAELINTILDLTEYQIHKRNLKRQESSQATSEY